MATPKFGPDETGLALLHCCVFNPALWDPGVVRIGDRAEPAQWVDVDVSGGEVLEPARRLRHGGQPQPTEANTLVSTPVQHTIIGGS